MSINSFIIAVEKENFVEAHELLEDEWKDYKKAGEKNKAKAVQGLINGATSLALFRKNRIDAYKKIWKVFEKYENLIEEVELNDKEKYKEARELLRKKRVKVVN